MLPSRRTLRRLYFDLVKRRSRVRVVSANEPTDLVAPIFVLGLYRSGTTLMRYVLDSHSQISCPPESSFLASLAELADSQKNLTGFAGMGFDRDQVLVRLRQFSAYFFETYSSSWDKPRWADKSPNCVDHADFLAELFPTAQFIVVLRQPLDQIDSMVGADLAAEVLEPHTQPGDDLRIAAARYWSEKTTLLLDFEDRFHERCHRVRYEDLCLSPESVLKEVFGFLGEDWEPQVLRFEEQHHDHGAEDGWVASSGGFEHRTHTQDDWPPTVLEECKALTHPILEQAGYGPTRGS